MLDEFYQPLEHLGLAPEMAVKGGFRHSEPRSERRRRDFLAGRVLQHLRHRLENLVPALACLCRHFGWSGFKPVYCKCASMRGNCVRFAIFTSTKPGARGARVTHTVFMP